MNSYNLIPLVARICLSAIFLRSAIISGILNFSSTQQMIAGQGLPVPALLLAGNIVLQIIGGISLVLGYKARWGAIILILFLIPTTLVFHPFWSNPAETIAFLKNLGLIGGLLLVTYVGAGAISVDGATTSSSKSP
ncbi:MAG: DoxX family protein [Cyanobacteria bacterium QH_6_48_35]|nr:MAG: DoxX family protein [Cyanobacteria bacterium QH_6_48_35]